VNVNAHFLHTILSLAAKAAGLPSVLITNFTFDSVYSYLSTPVTESPFTTDQLSLTARNHDIFEHLVPDVPVPLSDLAPLVEQIHAGYRCADLLLLLPGCIPIPSFFLSPRLPSQDWIDPQTSRFRPEIVPYVTQWSSSSTRLHPFVPFTTCPAPNLTSRRCFPRAVLPAPLLVRPISDSSLYTSPGRSRFLSSIGVPVQLHDPYRTRILIVSFGGQVFRRPLSRPPSRPSSRLASWSGSMNTSRSHSPEPTDVASEFLAKYAQESNPITSPVYRHGIDGIPDQAVTEALHSIATHHSTSLSTSSLIVPSTSSPRLATSSHIWIPGAPPVSKPLGSPSSPQQNELPTFSMTLSTPPSNHCDGYFEPEDQGGEGPRLLPDSSWIAIVCGVSKEQWNELESDSELPEGFFVAPLDVYMPDLMAVADVLLGKLVNQAFFNCSWNETGSYLDTQGYGTVSECIDSCSPFVYGKRSFFPCVQNTDWLIHLIHSL